MVFEAFETPILIHNVTSDFSTSDDLGIMSGHALGLELLYDLFSDI